MTYTPDLDVIRGRCNGSYECPASRREVLWLLDEVEAMRTVLERIATFESRHGPSDEADLARQLLEAKS